MKVGFLSNQIDNRGTGNALFDYAHYNETILGNQSYIFTLDTQSRNPFMELRLLERFGIIYNHPEVFPVVDVLYHIKYGNKEFEQYKFPFRYVVHAVFDGSQPHGDRYAAISQWLGKRYSIPWVPHIVSLPESGSDLRISLNIPPMATVFGRHGGPDTFDIPFAWSAINKALKEKDDIYFLFLNTNKPDIELVDSNRVIFLPETEDPINKREFINTCDVMLHARQRGETFGIAVGEFCIAGRPIITYGNSPEKAHLDMISKVSYIYYTEDELVEALEIDWHPVWARRASYYDKCTPEKVMQKFKEVFLD